MAAKWLSRALSTMFAILALSLGSDQATAYYLSQSSYGEFSGEATDSTGLMAECGGKFNLCGYLNRDGQQAIARQFEVALPFNEGLAGVCIDGTFGFIDRTGTLVVSPGFDLVGAFQNGLAEVVVNGKAGVIDRQGQMVVAPNYARAMPFGLGTALIREGEGVSEPYAECEQLDNARSALGWPQPWPNLYRFLDIPTSTIVSDAYHLRYFNDPRRGLIFAKRMETGRFGLVRSDGAWQTATLFQEASSLTDGLAIVCLNNHQNSAPNEQEKCGAIDETGRLVVPMEFDITSRLTNGMFLVKNGGRKGFVDSTGVLVGGRYFDDARFVTESDVNLVLIDDIWVGLDRRGKIVANPEDGTILKECASGLRVEKFSDRVRFVDSNGRATTPYLFDFSYNFDPHQNNFDCLSPNMVELNGKYSFVDGAGRLIIDPPTLESLHSFNGKYATVKSDGKWGIINVSGEYTVSPKFDDINRDGDLFAVSIGERKYWIDFRGIEMPEPNRAEDRAGVLACGRDGGHLVSAEVAGNIVWGLADADGAIFVQPKYRAMRCYDNGLAWVTDDVRRMWCKIDTKGNVRDPSKCTTGYNGRTLIHGLFEKFSDDAFESSVLWERAFLDYGRGARKTPPQIISTGPTRQF